MTLTEHLSGVANAIRSKTGETGSIPASQFAAKIEGIETGSADLAHATMTAKLPTRVGSRSISVTFTTLSSVKYVVCSATYFDSTDTRTLHLLAANCDGVFESIYGKAENIVVSDATVTFYTAALTSANYIDVYFTAFGDPA